MKNKQLPADSPNETQSSHDGETAVIGCLSVDLFSEIEIMTEKKLKEKELHRLRRVTQWLKAYFIKGQKSKSIQDSSYWVSYNMMQGYSCFEDVMKRALDELVYSGFLIYFEKKSYFLDGRSYQHAQVYEYAIK